MVLYVCEHCGGEMMAPVEMGPDVEYVENYKDPDTDIILDFSDGNVIIHPYATITVSLVPEESVPEDLQSDIEVKFGEYTDFYVWYNVSINYGNESQVYCVAPTGEYKVSIPAPLTIDDNKTTRVCIVSPNYDFVKTVETEEADGRLYFTTDTFGNFIVVGDEDPMYIVGYQSKNGGSGSHPADMVEPGESYTLNDCSYLIPPEGFRFKCWEIDGVEYQPGDTITINKDTYVYAIWELIPVEDDEPDEPNEPVEPVYPDDPTGGEGNDQPEEKDHSKCQANGWKRFWNAIGNFFRMIFGLPKKCVCGDKIYE